MAVTTHGCYGQNNKCCGIDTSCCLLNNSSYGFDSIYVAWNHSCYGFDSSFNVSTRVSVKVTSHAEGGQQLLWDLITVAVKLTFLCDCASLTCAINLYIFSEVRCVLCVCVCTRTYLLVHAGVCTCMYVCVCSSLCACLRVYVVLVFLCMCVGQIKEANYKQLQGVLNVLLILRDTCWRLLNALVHGSTLSQRFCGVFVIHNNWCLLTHAHARTHTQTSTQKSWETPIHSFSFGIQLFTLRWLVFMTWMVVHSNQYCMIVFKTCGMCLWIGSTFWHAAPSIYKHQSKLTASNLRQLSNSSCK